MRQYALERLFTDDASGDQAWCKLQMLLGERIEQGLAGQISAPSIGAITKKELSTSQHS